MATPRPSLEELASRKGFTLPAEQARSHLCTHRLKREDERRLVFRPTVMAFVSSWVILLCGVMLALWAVQSPNLGAKLGRFALGAATVWWGGYLLRSSLAPIVFDKREGFHWRGKGPAARDERARQELTPLANVVALQLLREQFMKRPPGFELNLVLANGERVHVLDHGNQRALSADARSLGEFLGVPVLEGEVDFEDYDDALAA